MNKSIKWLGITSVVTLFLGVTWFSLNTESEDVYLYLECQNINTGRLDILLFDVDGQEIANQKIQLNRACNQPGSVIIKGIKEKFPGVIIYLYSAEGKRLFTNLGSRKDNNILLDQKGFHIDLNLNGHPLNVAWHSL